MPKPVWFVQQSGDNWWLWVRGTKTAGPFPDKAAALLGALEWASDLQHSIAAAIIDLKGGTDGNVVGNQ